MSIRVSKTTCRGDLCWILSNNSRSLPDLVKDIQISTNLVGDLKISSISSQSSQDPCQIWIENLMEKEGRRGYWSDQLQHVKRSQNQGGNLQASIILGENIIS